MIDVFAYDSDSKSVVHCLIEKIAKKLNHIWMMLGFK